MHISCSTTCSLRSHTMQKHQAFLREEFCGMIQKLWEQLVQMIHPLLQESQAAGQLHFQRGQYFLTKMEHSLQNPKKIQLPHHKYQGQINFDNIPIIENIEDNPPTLQFNHLCEQIYRYQAEISNNQKHADAKNSQETCEMRNNVSPSDFKIAQMSIQRAIQIFEKELLKTNQSQQSKAELAATLSFAKGKRAIIFMIGAKYKEAVTELQAIINQLKERAEKAESNEFIAEYTFLLGNCILLIDEEGCQQVVLKLFMDAMQMYLDHLQLKLNYDTSHFSLPVIGKMNVERFPYLCKADDPENVKLVKEVMNIILDKIEDVCQLIHIKEILAKQNEQSTFKAEHRGTRKRKPSESPILSPAQQFMLAAISTNSNEKQRKQIQ